MKVDFLPACINLRRCLAGALNNDGCSVDYTSRSLESGGLCGTRAQVQGSAITFSDWVDGIYLQILKLLEAPAWPADLDPVDFVNRS